MTAYIRAVSHPACVGLLRQFGTIKRKFIAFAVGTLAILLVLVFSVAASLYFPYTQEIERTQSYLADSLQIQSNLLHEMIASTQDPDWENTLQSLGNPELASLLLEFSILQDHFMLAEVSIGKRKADQVDFLLTSHGGKVDRSKTRVDIDGALDSAMRLALDGKTGSGISMDHDGKEILAAYKWDPEFEFGLVAKIPMSVIRQPYLKAMAVNSGSWVLVLLGLALLARFAAASILRRIEITESEHQAIFNSASDGIVVVDGSGIIRSFNPAAKLMFGYDEEELTGHSLDLLMVENADVESGFSLKNLSYCARDSACRAYEFPARRKNGSLFTVSALLSEIKVKGQRLITLMLRDVTEQSTTARALFKAKEAAESATQLKSQFLANMSHEIRSPMNGVIGMLELLKNTELTPEQGRYQNLALESATSLLTIINDILDLSKIESGHLTLENIAFDVKHLIEQVKDQFSEAAQSKGLELNIEFPVETPSLVNGDPFRLRQVLVNLVNNAIKFTRHGHVKIFVDNISDKNDFCELLFKVSDSGCGIPEDKQAELFTPYVQAALSDSRLSGGTGLGLSICKSLIELMGGNIDFSSQVGEGTTFWFSVIFEKTAAVPDVPSHVQSERTATQPLLENNKSVFGKRRHRMLVADDNEVNCILCRDILSPLGIDVVTVSDGQQAFEQIKKTQFDLVLMDCQMPVMDGHAASRKIRAWECEQGLSRTPIIALTAHAMEGDRESSLAAGMDDYLSKPFRFQQLQSMLSTFLVLATPESGKDRLSLVARSVSAN